MKSFVHNSILILSLLWLTSCSSLLYYPTPDYYYPPHRFGLKPQEFWITLNNQKKIFSWYFKTTNPIVDKKTKSEKSKGLIVFLHGNGENISSHYLQLSWILDDGYDLFIFDYPGYGLSEGEANTDTVVSASSEALTWAYQFNENKPIIIYGQSMGGITALKALENCQDQIKIAALILDGTFYSYQKIAREKLSEHWLTWILQPFAYILLSDDYAPQNYEHLNGIPKLVIVGLRDTLVPPHWGQELYNKLPDPKTIWEQPYAKHTETFWTEDKMYRIKFLNYLDQVLIKN
ncbi:MAG: alpha/beta hydrolase [Pseudobdellovibrio sp.]